MLTLPDNVNTVATVTELRSKTSELIELAQTGAIAIQKNNVTVGYMVGVDDFEKLSKKK